MHYNGWQSYFRFSYNGVYCSKALWVTFQPTSASTREATTERAGRSKLPLQYDAASSCDLDSTLLDNGQLWPDWYVALWHQMLEITTLLANQGREFSLELKIGQQFSFHANSKGMRTFPARGSLADEPGQRKKKCRCYHARQTEEERISAKKERFPLLSHL